MSNIFNDLIILLLIDNVNFFYNYYYFNSIINIIISSYLCDLIVQRFGEEIGDFGKKFGYLKFSNYNNNTKHSKSEENLLNKVWYQPERIFLVDGTPEVWQPAFWVPVDKTYFEIARKLKVCSNPNHSLITSVCFVLCDKIWFWLIYFVKLILIKGKFNVKIFMFYYIHVKDSWIINLSAKSYKS